MEIESKNISLMREIIITFKAKGNNYLSKKNLTFMQVHFLLSLEEIGGFSSFKEMEKFLCIAQSTTVDIINKLVDKGYINCFLSEKDKRMKVMELSLKGKELCLELKDIFKKNELCLFDGLTLDEQYNLFILLSRIQKNLNKVSE